LKRLEKECKRERISSADILSKYIFDADFYVYKELSILYIPHQRMASMSGFHRQWKNCLIASCKRENNKRIKIIQTKFNVNTSE